MNTSLKSLEEMRKRTASFPRNPAIREWKERGGKAIGYLCTYVPEELLCAAVLLPVRIAGDSRELELERANSYLYINNCSMIRSCLELALQGQYGLLDGLVAGYTCDGARRLFDVWKQYLPLPFMRILLVPRKFTQEALELYREEVAGSMLNNPHFIRAIEEMGAWVVTDELCTGTRSFWDLVDPALEPIQGIARRYLNNFPCARMDPPEERFHRIDRIIREFGVQGVVSQIIRYCAPYEHDQPFLTRHIGKEMGVPVLSLDVEYGQGGTGQIQTRVQAFLEMLEGVGQRSS